MVGQVHMSAGSTCSPSPGTKSQDYTRPGWGAKRSLYVLFFFFSARKEGKLQGNEPHRYSLSNRGKIWAQIFQVTKFTYTAYLSCPNNSYTAQNIWLPFSPWILYNSNVGFEGRITLSLKASSCVPCSAWHPWALLEMPVAPLIMTANTNSKHSYVSATCQQMDRSRSGIVPS